MTPQFIREYRREREWQAKLAADGTYGLTVYESGRTERTFGSAPYGEHAISAFKSAKRAVHFRERLPIYIKNKKRA